MENENLKKELDYLLKQQQLLAEIAIKLTKSEEFSETINYVINQLGEYTQVNRVYIFEDRYNNKESSNTYEWVKEGTTPQIKNLQNVPYSDLASWEKILKEKKKIIAEDINDLPVDLYEYLGPQNIKSILVFPIETSKRRFGFIGFDTTEEKRKWKETDVYLLETVSSILSNVYASNRVKTLLEEKIHELKKINELMVGRELRMSELKEEIKKLEK
ncbi:GAF domain-containing protein [Patescibacteria group bacterium]|nr:GAF domain-containing protein [Patescibacteria group bacterium]